MPNQPRAPFARAPEPQEVARMTQHTYLGDGHWRADAERTASHFPKCSCGWVGSSVSARQEAHTTGKREWNQHAPDDDEVAW